MGNSNDGNKDCLRGARVESVGECLQFAILGKVAD